MTTKNPAKFKRIPKLSFTEPIGNDTSFRSARGTVCECGFREFTLTMVKVKDEYSLWAQCTTCKQSYRVTIYHH